MSRGNRNGNSDGGGSVGEGDCDGDAISTMEVTPSMIFQCLRDVELVHF